MSVVAWNPFREFETLLNPNRYVPVDREDELTARPAWSPLADISETDRAYRIDIELPAVAAEAVDVSVKDGVLVISGERKSEREEGDRSHRVERRYGAFRKSFRLPENANEDAISAEAKHGVLYLTIEKREKEQPRAIEVKVH